MVELINLQKIQDSRGSLIALEELDFKFKIKRVYYLFESIDSAARGYHAHKNLSQFFICISGTCTVNVEYDGKKESFTLVTPDQALYFTGVVWREIHNMSNDCVLIVFASEQYDESDYIRDYQEFLNFKHLEL